MSNPMKEMASYPEGAVFLLALFTGLGMLICGFIFGFGAMFAVLAAVAIGTIIPGMVCLGGIILLGGGVMDYWVFIDQMKAIFLGFFMICLGFGLGLWLG